MAGRSRGNSSPYQKLRYVDEEDEGKDSDSGTEATRIKRGSYYSNVKHAEIKDIEMGMVPVRRRKSSIFQEVNSKEDPALSGESGMIDEQMALRIMRENNLADILLASDRHISI